MSASTRGFYWRHIVRPYPRQVAVILGLMFGGAALDMAAVGLTVPLFDALMRPDQPLRGIALTLSVRLDAWGWPHDGRAVVFALLGCAAVLFIAQSALLFLDQLATNVIAVRLRRELKCRLFERFLRGEYEAVTAYPRGTVVHHVNDPAMDLYKAILSLGQLCTSIAKCVFMIGLMAMLSWWATAAVGLLAVVGVQGWRLLANRRAAAYGRAIYDARAEQAKIEADAIDGLKVVKAHGVEREVVGRDEALLRREAGPTLRLVAFRYGPQLVNELVAAAVVLSLGAATFFLPGLGIRFSMLVAFLVAVRRVAPAMATINASSIELSRARRVLEVVEEVLSLPQEPQGGEVLTRIESLRFDGVSFTYTSRPDRPVLQQVSLDLRRGTVTAIVGSTGAGKSTLANLVLGLYRPSAGQVWVNRTPLAQLDLAVWRRSIGYVSQDVFVFNASIRDNIALGHAATDEEIAWAARVAQLDAFIGGLPEGYATVVGDRGLRLSGGQCQRLAIARALLRRPPVLIFDEATSALDNVTERAVYDAISATRHDAIVLVIAHRLSTVKDADQILVLHQGRIAEQGTHRQLLARGGAYAGLYTEREEGSAESRLVSADG